MACDVEDVDGVAVPVHHCTGTYCTTVPRIALARTTFPRFMYRQALPNLGWDIISDLDCHLPSLECSVENPRMLPARSHCFPVIFLVCEDDWRHLITRPPRAAVYCCFNSTYLACEDLLVDLACVFQQRLAEMVKQERKTSKASWRWWIGAYAWSNEVYKIAFYIFVISLEGSLAFFFLILIMRGFRIEEFYY